MNELNELTSCDRPVLACYGYDFVSSAVRQPRGRNADLKPDHAPLPPQAQGHALGQGLLQSAHLRQKESAPAAIPLENLLRRVGGETASAAVRLTRQGVPRLRATQAGSSPS